MSRWLNLDLASAMELHGIGTVEPDGTTWCKCELPPGKCTSFWLVAEVERLKGIVDVLENFEQPWDTRGFVKRLALATEHLLLDHDCDHRGYEDNNAAVVAAKQWLVSLAALGGVV